MKTLLREVDAGSVTVGTSFTTVIEGDLGAALDLVSWVIKNTGGTAISDARLLVLDHTSQDWANADYLSGSDFASAQPLVYSQQSAGGNYLHNLEAGGVTRIKAKTYKARKARLELKVASGSTTVEAFGRLVGDETDIS